MSALDILKERINYNGGKQQESRMILDKLRSLKKALLYSYQAETAVIFNKDTWDWEKEFRCLINPDVLKEDYDHKIISIPFKDICLNTAKVGKTTEGEEDIDLHQGDVIKWKENDSYWLVYLQNLEETAYFRAQLCRCRYEVEIGEHKYKVYVRGPVETTIQWNLKKNVIWNNLNYSLIMLITKNEETENFFHRFTEIKVNNKMWEVQAVDSISIEGVIQVALEETYTNTIQEVMDKKQDDTPIPAEDEPHIDGDSIVYPYRSIIYTIRNAENGEWICSSPKIKILESNPKSITIGVISGKSGSFKLIYRRENEDDIEKDIKISSL